MADTRDSITIPNDNDWHSVSELTNNSITAGMACIIQVQSTKSVRSAISSTKPDVNFRGWVLPAEPSNPAMVSAGEAEVWLKGDAVINIQEV